MPYARVPEWHPGGHGLHGHVALGRYVRKGVIEEAWGHGFIDVRMMSYLPIGSGIEGEAPQASKYLAKYVRKGMDVRGGGAPGQIAKIRRLGLGALVEELHRGVGGS